MNKIGRNDPCPCGSGKKYKLCCLDSKESRSAIGQATKTPALQVPHALDLALEHHQAGRLPQAESIYRQILQIEPNYPDALHYLGVIAFQLGKKDVALELMSKAIGANPHNPIYYSHLGNVLKDQGRLDAAVECYQKVLALDPNDAEAHYNLGNSFEAQGRLDEAVVSYHKALSLKPDYADAYNNLGTTLLDQAKPGEALATIRMALSFTPDDAEAYSNLLYSMQYDRTQSPSELLAEHRRYAARFEAPIASLIQRHGNTCEPERRLKIGYVSPDFRRHAVAYFIEPVLANHSKDQVEVFCYYNHTQRDNFTERIAGYADHWLVCKEMTDDQLAQRIRADGIDILVDLAGHTAKNRMLVFARKPAPIQITYLGYPGTSGLTAMDYRLTDGCADPAGRDACYSEALLRLPNSMWCYRPASDMPEVLPLPALKNGFITFGSFNKFNKIDSPCIELWAALLRALPGARLLLVTVAEGEARKRLAQQFAALGVTPERLEFHGQLPGDEFRRMLRGVDMTLDPINVNGATTTCESLWLGVPVISLSGTRFLSRAGLSIMSAAGLHDLVAASPEDYIKLAQQLAANLPLLAETRAGLRSRVAASALVDEVRFTRDLETVYREIWMKWCVSAA